MVEEVDLDEESCAPQPSRRESVVATEPIMIEEVDLDDESCAPQSRRRESVVATEKI